MTTKRKEEKKRKKVGGGEEGEWTGKMEMRIREKYLAVGKAFVAII